MHRPLEFGVCLHKITDVTAESKRAEKEGFDFFACGEHIFSRGPVDNSLIALAAAAGSTSTIQLMSTVTLAPLYSSALLTKQVVTLDQVSNGRFHFGVGIGGEIPEEFSACNVRVKDRGSRTNETLQIFKKLCTDDNVDFDGKYCSLNGVTLSPKPLHKPHPAIWISGRSEAAMQRCAQFGNGWLPYMYSPERLAASLEQIDGFLKASGQTRTIRKGIYIPLATHEDNEIARTMAIDTLSKEYNQDFSCLVDKYAVAGDPIRCVKRLMEYIAAGAETLIFGSAATPENHYKSQALLTKEIIPHLKR